MRSETIILLGIVAACAIVSVSAGGGKGKGGHWDKMKKCGDGELNQEEAMKGMKECMAEGKKGGDEAATEQEERRRRSPMEGGRIAKGKGKGKGGKHWKKNACSLVCTWKKQGVLDESGQFSEAGNEEHVNKVYPEDKRADALSKSKACADAHSSEFSMDDNCAGYKKFKHCLFKAHAETCGWKFGKHGGGGGGGKKEKEEDEE